MTLEEKEIEFTEYVARMISGVDTTDAGAVRRLSINLIRDFNDQCDNFNKVIDEELTEVKEELYRAKNAINKISEIYNEWR